jgi:Spy/CpxP family protein refolding chaperone
LRFLAARPFPLDLVFFLAFSLGSAFLMAAALATSCSEIDGNQKDGNVSQFRHTGWENLDLGRPDLV